MYSLIIPVYKNEGSIPDLLQALTALNASLHRQLEVVFVLDASPDASLRLLREALPEAAFSSVLVVHSRNFGSFSAIRTGLQAASGEYFGVMAADLQEPTELFTSFIEQLKTGHYDVALGIRQGRSDPWFSRSLSALYWRLYRLLIQPEMPAGGIDVFGCNRAFRDVLLQLKESNSSLVGLLIWMGFRRVNIPYTRQPRLHGRSSWTLQKKWRYFSDSIFAFSDLPIRILTFSGAIGIAFSILLAVTVVLSRLFGLISIPGYSATVLTILFFGALNCFGIGIVGSYVWRALENTKGRPGAIVISRVDYKAKGL